MAEILHPDWITVKDNGIDHAGYDQEWYPEKRQKLAGCGPTAGSMMAAYIERKQQGKIVATRDEALSVMLEIWKYATPRMHGLYKTRWLKEGLTEYMKERGLKGKVEALPIPSIRLLAPKLPKVAAFITEGLEADCPMGFLNLHSGDEPIPYHWHWMPLVKIEEKEGEYYCTLWDEGKPHVFNLGSWLAKTKFGGGFVRIIGS
ncbi:hypothetical protein [uncultured Dialister sp.]|uniref:hypothetical protein n=1 Tax=uncultured Dialister sp. TaxID=278064 RepID=UPI0025F5E5AF|nr:hypothetical protein [uncultured Dialister sp.]